MDGCQTGTSGFPLDAASQRNKSQMYNRFIGILQVNLHLMAPTSVKNWMILLEQSFLMTLLILQEFT